jgi:hypothetical protein
VSERYDTSDLDAIRELRRSKGWALVSARIFDQIELGRNELETGSIEPGFSRGKVKGLRIGLGVPEILETEIKHEVKE